MKFKSRWFCFSVAGLSLFAARTQAQEDWTRNFRVGLQLGINVSADFKTGGQFGLSASQPGTAGSGLNHSYDDGYVNVDENVGPAPDYYTSYWGYSSPSQIDGTLLTFHGAKSADITSATSSDKDDAPYLGLDMAYGATIRQWRRSRLGWEVGFGLLPIEIKDSRPLSGTFVTTVHQFNTEGTFGPIVIPGIISGDGYNGGPSGLGANIPNIAAELPDETTSGMITGTRTLDVHFLTLRLGPTYYWNLHPRWTVSASAGGAVGLITGDYRFDETATLSSGSTTHLSGKFGQTEPTYGGYLSGLVLFHLQPDADLFVGAQFMPLTDVTFSKGGREAKLDLGTGLYFTAGINWPF
jgi:hypothetical protein